jgi:hypothetical protein
MSHFPLPHTIYADYDQFLDAAALLIMAEL